MGVAMDGPLLAAAQGWGYTPSGMPCSRKKGGAKGVQAVITVGANPTESQNGVRLFKRVVAL